MITHNTPPYTPEVDPRTFYRGTLTFSDRIIDMDSKNEDSYEYRSQGGRLQVGLSEDDTVSSFIKVDGQLICITRKNVTMPIMADDTDPNRTNPEINHNVQHILPYGSDSEYVGRTLQQAGVLFDEHSLPELVSFDRGRLIAFNFMKEITSLDKARNDYLSEVSEINSTISGRGGIEHIPSLPNLEQKLKSFILNMDHSIRMIMELVQLFYPQITNKGWNQQLSEHIEKTQGAEDPFSVFTKKAQGFTELMRVIRNSIEHPDNNNVLTVNNYMLNPRNQITQPTITFVGLKNSLPETNIATFMESSITSSLTIFESFMAYLCNAHAEPFAGDKRVVVQVPEDERSDNEKHVSFQYQILWTK